MPIANTVGLAADTKVTVKPKAVQIVTFGFGTAAVTNLSSDRNLVICLDGEGRLNIVQAE